MVSHISFGNLVPHGQAQSDFRWNPFHAQSRVVREAKSNVETWIANQDTPLSPRVPNRLQPIVDKCLANSLSLKCWKNGNRPERKPAAILSVDLDRREGDLPHDVAIDFGNQRDGQGIVGS